MARSSSIVCVAVVNAACGDNRLQPDATTAVCGNFLVEPGEDCDDGDAVADAICTATCRFTSAAGVRAS